MDTARFAVHVDTDEMGEQELASNLQEWIIHRYLTQTFILFIFHLLYISQESHRDVSYHTLIPQVLHSDPHTIPFSSQTDTECEAISLGRKMGQSMPAHRECPALHSSCKANLPCLLWSSVCVVCREHARKKRYQIIAAPVCEDMAMNLQTRFPER
jgi:hypothetical protein